MCIKTTHPECNYLSSKIRCHVCGRGFDVKVREAKESEAINERLGTMKKGMMDRWWMDACVDGWTDGWMDVWMDGTHLTKLSPLITLCWEIYGILPTYV